MRSSHIGQFSNSPIGNIFATAKKAFSCHFSVVPCISSQFRVASCTSRCSSYVRPPSPALINEKAFKVPNAVMTSTFGSVSNTRRLSGIPCRSKTAISDSISAARGFCLLIISKDIFHVLKIEFWLSESLLRSPRSSLNRLCISESFRVKSSRYSFRVMPFSLMKAAACVIASGMYPKASRSVFDSSIFKLVRQSI